MCLLSHIQFSLPSGERWPRANPVGGTAGSPEGHGCSVAALLLVVIMEVLFWSDSGAGLDILCLHFGSDSGARSCFCSCNIALHKLYVILRVVMTLLIYCILLLFSGSLAVYW